jgi:anaphase-promoting complex subunit 10
VEVNTGASRKDTSEIGKLAVWSVTSAKPGNGVELLRDNNLDTYWQSDGAQPHLVNIQFQKKVRLHELAIYADYKLDESYTPSKISVRAGNSFHDLREIKVVDLEEPMGWVRFPLTDQDEGGAGGAAVGVASPRVSSTLCFVSSTLVHTARVQTRS